MQIFGDWEKGMEQKRGVERRYRGEGGRVTMMRNMGEEGGEGGKRGEV